MVTHRGQHMTLLALLTLFGWLTLSGCEAITRPQRIQKVVPHTIAGSLLGQDYQTAQLTGPAAVAQKQAAQPARQRLLLQQLPLDVVDSDNNASTQQVEQPLLQQATGLSKAQPAADTSADGSNTSQAMGTASPQQQQQQQPMSASPVNGTGIPSATPSQMRVAQVGSPNDIPTAPEGNVPVITTPPAAALPLYVSPDPSLESLTEINVGQELLQIPRSFLGLSHEWTHVEELNNIPGYKDILNMLTAHGSGPMIIRVGGGSTDKQSRLFPQYVYEALRQVHQDTGALFILGLNFEKSDIGLTKKQFEAAHAILPPESIITFEIGNEPNYYEGTKTDSQGQPLTALQYIRGNFVVDWYSFAKQLSCPCGTNDCCTYKQFAGPVWGHVNVFPTTIKWFLDQTVSYVNLTTVHWYKATKETYNTPSTLLEEAPIRQEMDNLRAIVQTSQGYGIPLRVAEMNTISNSGRVGVSNVFAAAIWTLDGCFEVAATGAVGVNLHQGSGQNLYTGILRWYNQGVLSPPVLRPPFYGMLMFQQAVKAGSKLLGKTQISGDNGNLKVWPLKDVGDQELRIVVINKHPSQAAKQVIRLDRSQGSGYDSPALVSRLVARGEDPLSATSGITIGGFYYAVGGVQKGDDATETVPMMPTVDGKVSWTLYMPPGSAAVVTIPYGNDK